MIKCDDCKNEFSIERLHKIIKENFNELKNDTEYYCYDCYYSQCCNRCGYLHKLSKLKKYKGKLYSNQTSPHSIYLCELCISADDDTETDDDKPIY